MIERDDDEEGKVHRLRLDKKAESFPVIADAAEPALRAKEVAAAKWGSITRVDIPVDNLSDTAVDAVPGSI